MSLAPLEVLLKSRLSTIFGLAIREACVIARANVAKVTHEIHHLVVAQERDDAAASLRRLLIERQHQVQNLARLWSAIDEIAKLKKSGIAAGPVALLVDEPYALQNGAEVVEISVDIADGDEQWCRVRRRGCRAGRQSQQQHTYQMYILKNAR